MGFRSMIWPALLFLAVLAPAQSPRARVRLEKEVRHELVMLPFYGVFDNLAFKIDGYKVTLLGQVTRPT
jgi:hyperosmotically inducible protein